MRRIKQVLCDVGGNTYGIDIAHVQGIEKQLNITQVPNVPRFIEGIAKLRDRVIPVFSLHKKFGAEVKQETGDSKYIIVKLDDLLLAFQVDMVAEIVELSEDKFMPAPQVVHSEETEYIDSIVSVDDKLVIVLDINGVLTEKEKEKLTKVVNEC